MCKLISITAIAAGAMLLHLLPLETSRPDRPANQCVAATPVSPVTMLELAADFHVRLLIAAGEKLDLPR
jgi:hypothetical protein